MSRVKVFRDWLDKKPSDRFARYSLALELRQSGELSESETEFQRLLLDHPDSAAGAMQLASLLDELDRGEEGVLVLEASVKVLEALNTPEAARDLAEVRAELELLSDLL